MVFCSINDSLSIALLIRAFGYDIGIWVYVCQMARMREEYEYIGEMTAHC